MNLMTIVFNDDDVHHWLGCMWTLA